MNNKGMTLVELLVTFSLLMVIVVGMFNLILDVKSDLDVKQTSKRFLEFSNIENHDIHMDMLKNKPIAIAIKRKADGYWTCRYSTKFSYEEDCLISSDVFSFILTKSNGSSTTTITGNTSLNNICTDIYPCLVYAYYDQENTTSSSVTASFKVMAFNKDREKVNSKGEKYGIGIKYGNTYEQVPDQKYINYLISKPSIKVSSGLLVIDYPLYATGDENNYGFKIVYPLDQ